MSDGGHNTASIMLHSGKDCTIVSKRCVPHCGLKPQLKEAWSTIVISMRGHDMAMVRNTLLLLSPGV